MTERVPDVLRMLDPSERYFWLFDQLAPMNAVTIAELDVEVDPRALRLALAALQRHHPLLRARIAPIEGNLAFVATTDAIPLRVVGGPARWPDVVTDELDAPFSPGEGPLARCVLVPMDDHRSVVLLTVHHAITDGQAVVRALQYVLRFLENGGGEPAPLSLPPPIHERFPDALRSPRAAIDVVKAVRAERVGQGQPAAFGFHDRSAEPRSTCLDRLVLKPDDIPRLRAEPQALGAGVQGMLAAATLRASAALLGGSQDHLICLLTPTDLRQRVVPTIPEDAMMVAIGLLCTPYAVSAAGDPDLARRITEQTRREIARGESHLFYRLARAAAFAPTDDGIRTFAEWMSTTPDNVTVSNVGLIDHTDDPPWVRSVHAALGASSNQVVFVAATTYRGTMIVDVTSDAVKLPSPEREQLVAGIEKHIGAARLAAATRTEPSE